MLQKLLSNKTQIFLLALCLLCFALIRTFENVLFYDPLLDFFKADYHNATLPEMNFWKLYGSLSLRYLLNTILSVFIIYVLFKNSEHIKLVIVLYSIFFVVLLVLFALFLHYFSERVMAIFYIRRFLIQPVLLLLFIPGFYFQQFQSKKS